MKDEVVEAVLKVCKRVPCWNVPKEWLVELYESTIEDFDGKDFTAQVDTLGARVKYMYFRKHYMFFDSTRLDVEIFRWGVGDTFIRHIDWSKSAENGWLTDLLGHPICG